MELMEDHSEAVIKQCQILALKGDSTALRLCMERLVPPCRAPRNQFRLPTMKTMADLGKALPAVAREVARGRLSAQDGEAFSKMIETQRRTIEAEGFERRLRAVEKAQKRRPRRPRKVL